jgi:hypothetical protein
VLQGRSQNCNGDPRNRDARNVECLQKKAIGSEQSQNKRLCGLKMATEVKLPKPAEAYIMIPCDLDADMKLEDLMFALLDFSLVLVSSLLSMPLFSPFGMVTFTLYIFM